MIDGKERLGVYHKSFLIAELLENYTVTYMERSSTSQDELRAMETKTKMRRNSSMTHYITKHRILRNDMIDANCDEVV